MLDVGKHTLSSSSNCKRQHQQCGLHATCRRRVASWVLAHLQLGDSHLAQPP